MARNWYQLRQFTAYKTQVIPVASPRASHECPRCGTVDPANRPERDRFRCVFCGLTAVIKPTLAVPHYHAFHSGWLGDRMITKGDPDPRHYADAVARIAPKVDVRAGNADLAVTLAF